jgi:maltose O-acetyltransferase
MTQFEALSKVSRGQNTYLIRCFIDSNYPHLIQVGENCIIVDACLLCHDAPSRVIDQLSPVGKIVIGDNVGVGTGATILYGTVIGDGCLIGGGAFVAPGTIVPSGEFWGGVPARKIGTVEEFIERRRKIFESQSPVENFANLAPGQLYYRRLTADAVIPWTERMKSI